MNAKYTAKHTETATDLYELRDIWLRETELYANAIESVETRLAAKLCLIADTLTIEETENENTAVAKKEEPTTEPECFIFLASHINSQLASISNRGYELAYQWLALDASKSVAADAALTLYPPTDKARLFKLYDEQESLRPTLFRLYRKQMQALPRDLVTIATTADSASTPLKIEALHYAAANPEIGQDLFRSHYLPLLSGAAEWDASILIAALWGGLVRGDPDATKAIRAALSQQTTAEAQTQLMRLAALSGQDEFLPLINMALEANPDTGYPLLVLFGKKSVMPALLKGLETAHSMEHAAASYTKLTDQILPRVPRLSVVGEDSDDAEDTPEQIPDIKAAHAWWNAHQANWKSDERYLFGKATSPIHLTAQSKKHAGRFGCDIMALLALSQQAPLNIPDETWRIRQTHLLDAQATTKPHPKPAVSKPPTQAASTRHA